MVLFMGCNVQSFPYTVGNQIPYESDACKFPVDNDFPFLLLNGFYYLASNLIRRHDKRIFLVGGQKSCINKSWLYVCDGDVAVFHVC